MRQEYQAELADVNRLLVTMAEQVRAALRKATEALLSADRVRAEEVVAADAETDAVKRKVEDRVYDLLARQAPVASDLRLVVTALHVAADLERMGDLAAHVAEVALRRLPVVAVPEELRPTVQDMAEAADRIGEKIIHVLATSDAERAAELEGDDDQIDELQKQLYGLMLGTAWRHGVEPAIDGAMLGRWYERFADHAVNAGKHIVYFVTGESVPAP
jgi:phosphate transport system protein